MRLFFVELRVIAVVHSGYLRSCRMLTANRTFIVWQSSQTKFLALHEKLIPPLYDQKKTLLRAWPFNGEFFRNRIPLCFTALRFPWCLSTLQKEQQISPKGTCYSGEILARNNHARYLSSFVHVCLSNENKKQQQYWASVFPITFGAAFQ